MQTPVKANGKNSRTTLDLVIRSFREISSWVVLYRVKSGARSPICKLTSFTLRLTEKKEIRGMWLILWRKILRFCCDPTLCCLTKFFAIWYKWCLQHGAKQNLDFCFELSFLLLFRRLVVSIATQYFNNSWFFFHSSEEKKRGASAREREREWGKNDNDPTGTARRKKFDCCPILWLVDLNMN